VSDADVGLAAEVESLGGCSAVVVGVQSVEDDPPTIFLSHPSIGARALLHRERVMADDGKDVL